MAGDRSRLWKAVLGESKSEFSARLQAGGQQPLEGPITPSGSESSRPGEPRSGGNAMETSNDESPAFAVVEVADWGSLIEAQLASVEYLRAGLTLVIGMLIAGGLLDLGIQADQARLLSCLGVDYCYVSGGTVWYVLSVGVAIVTGVVVGSIRGAANRHRKNAGG